MAARVFIGLRISEQAKDAVTERAKAEGLDRSKELRALLAWALENKPVQPKGRRS